jgi:hypothetical protein
MGSSDHDFDFIKAAIRRLEALERAASVTLSWQVTLLERQRNLVGDIGRTLESLRGNNKQESNPQLRGEKSSHCRLERRRFGLGGRQLTLSPLLAALFVALAKGTWQTAAALGESAYAATKRRLTKRALFQGLHRLRHELLVAGVKERIEYNRLLGWRLGPGDRKKGDM